ncbi:MAG: tetratricopeptide repeat protein [Myxococcota bacterium]
MHRHFTWWIACVLLVGTPRAVAQEAPSDETGAEESASEEAGDGEETNAEEANGGEDMSRNDETVEAMGDQEAKSRFRVGGMLYDEGRFREAAGEFEKAYEMSGKPALLYNMYIAYRDAGLTERAVEVLRKYLDEASDIPDRRKLEVRLGAMEKTLGGESDEGSPEGDARSEDGTAAGAEADAGAATPGPAQEDGGSKVVPWTITGLGAAILVAASVTGITALNKTNDIEEACTDDGRCPADFPLAQERTEARRWVRATDVLWPIGVAALGTGLVLFFLMGDDGEDDETAQETRWSGGLGCAPGGCAGELQVRF